MTRIPVRLHVPPATRAIVSPLAQAMRTRGYQISTRAQPSCGKPWLTLDWSANKHVAPYHASLWNPMGEPIDAQYFQQLRDDTILRIQSAQTADQFGWEAPDYFGNLADLCVGTMQRFIVSSGTDAAHVDDLYGAGLLQTCEARISQRGVNPLNRMVLRGAVLATGLALTQMPRMRLTWDLHAIFSLLGPCFAWTLFRHETEALASWLYSAMMMAKIETSWLYPILERAQAVFFEDHALVRAGYPPLQPKQTADEYTPAERAPATWHDPIRILSQTSDKVGEPPQGYLVASHPMLTPFLQAYVHDHTRR
jgi:hypothetical protein